MWYAFNPLISHCRSQDRYHNWNYFSRGLNSSSSKSQGFLKLKYYSDSLCFVFFLLNFVLIWNSYGCFFGSFLPQNSSFNLLRDFFFPFKKKTNCTNQTEPFRLPTELSGYSNFFFDWQKKFIILLHKVHTSMFGVKIGGKPTKPNRTNFIARWQQTSKVLNTSL